MNSTSYPYLILGIDTCATCEDVEKAYKNKVLKYHPDKFPKKMDATKKERYTKKFHALTQAKNDILKQLRQLRQLNNDGINRMEGTEEVVNVQNRHRMNPHPFMGESMRIGSIFEDMFNFRGVGDVFADMEERMQNMRVVDDGSNPNGMFYSRTEIFKNDNGRKMRSVKENKNGTIRIYDEVDGRLINNKKTLK